MSHHDPKTVDKLVKKYAHKVMRRLVGANTSFLHFADVEQELWVAYSMARDSYNPEMGAKFSTYLVRGMLLHINRVLNVQLFWKPELTYALSLNTPQDDENDATLESVTPGQTNTEAEIEAKLNYEFALTRLKPKARIFVRLLQEQPEELCAEVLKGHQKAEHGRAMGITVAIPRKLTARMIFDLLDYTPQDRKQVLAEVGQLGEKLCRQ